MKRFLVLSGALFLMLVVACSGFAASKIEGKAVDYTSGGVTMKGYIAYDAKIKGKRPAVLVVHEWWGHNEYARKRARMLADMGYTALAVDMYGAGKQATHPDDAGKFSSETMKNFDTAKARFEAAIDLLKKQPSVDPGRIAAIGYCFGGGVVLNMARQGVDLIAVVSFHGSLAAVKPDLIWAGISAMGPEYPDAPGYDPVIQAMAGVKAVLLDQLYLRGMLPAPTDLRVMAADSQITLLPASRARREVAPTGQQGAIKPAQLLLLDPQGIDVTKFKQ